MGKAGQKIVQHYTELRDATVLSVGVLNRIGDRQGDFIRLQNISQMLQGKDRNGDQMAPYKTATIKERSRLGVMDARTVNLKRSGKFHDSITAISAKSIVDYKEGTATIPIEISVPKKMAGRLKGFRSGHYGKKGRNDPRMVVGMADKGTPVYNAQVKRLKQIALEEERKAFTGAGLTVDTKDFGT